MTAGELAQALAGDRRPQRTATGWLTWCPAHADRKPSLHVSEQGGKLLVKCFAGCPQGAVIEALRGRGLWPSGEGRRFPTRQSRVVATYSYHDAAGQLVYQVVRLEPGQGGKKKEFRQRRPDGHGGWIWNLKGVARVPYRLPEVLKAQTIFVPEGEKDCEALRGLGLTATTNPGGAGKWRPEFNPYFQGKDIIILPDNDKPGRAHALDVARNLHGVSSSIKLVELPGLPEKGDVSDWLKGGGTKAGLLALVAAAPEWQPPAAGKDVQPKVSQSQALIKLAVEVELFHDRDGKAYATIPVDGHQETWPIRARGFRAWLLRRYFQATAKAPSAQAMQDALGVLEAQAHFDGQEHEVFVRIAHTDGKIYVDLANESWQAVAITPQGWRVVDNPPVKFRRPRGLAPLPTPKPGGSLDGLRQFVNCQPEDWPLIVAWLIGAFSYGPYPILILQGEQGVAKSTTARVLKSLVDPGHSPQRTAPRDVRDLMITASSSWCLSLDNLSNLPSWLSDGFCRLATGGGLGTRELYTDGDEFILDARRPLILNGIDSLVSRGDLADRAILLELPQIQDDDRRPEADLWGAFETAQPAILGAVFDAVSAALANVHQVKLAQLPRMADFATWVVAAEPALPWQPGTFLAAYTRNRAAVVEHSLEGDVVAVALRAFMEHRQEWEGTPTELLDELTGTAGDLVSRTKAWPKAANSLSNRLRRAAAFLRAVGIEVESGYVKRSRRLFIRKGVKNIVATVATVANQEYQGVTCNDPCNDATIHGKRSLQPKPDNHAGCNDSNDRNDEIPSFSAAGATPGATPQPAEIINDSNQCRTVAGVTDGFLNTHDEGVEEVVL